MSLSVDYNGTTIEFDESDITETLREFEFKIDDSEELFVDNPPVINVGEFVDKGEE